MIVSWKWLADYLKLEMSHERLAERLMMAGLNHESSERVGEDVAIDLEVTSNRPDCLGHLGIAREAAVLFGQELKLPAANPKAGGPPVAQFAQLRLDCPKLCPRYTARVIRGVKVGPSPRWLAERLQTIGQAPVNNVVDITNYVLMECGQPLHAFDLAKLAGRQIIVREAKAGEKFLAINHKSYDLEPGMCVIADAERAVALGGVMGGADSEVSAGTTELLIESAEFDPLSIRTTARKLNLKSDSSYRFERGVDPEGVDWASRRCCELILELCGGTLAEGVLDAGRQPAAREPVVLRLAQLPRILGIEIDAAEVRRILLALGNKVEKSDAQAITVTPPSWRRDVSREIDLVEEVARIHGYEAIPEDARVPMAPSHRTPLDRAVGKVRHALTAAGCDEALTVSIVEAAWTESFSPWTDQPALTSSMPLMRGADRLRTSLVPSLLAARKVNEAVANPVVELFETARVYLAQPGGLPREELLLGVTTGGGFFRLKGILEATLATIDPALRFELAELRHDLFAAGKGAELRLNGERWGVLGEVSAAGLERFGLRSPAAVAEVRLEPLVGLQQTAQAQSLAAYPAVSRDLNFVVDEAVRWAALEAVVRKAAGEKLETLAFQELYRDAKRLGHGKKSLLLSAHFRDAGGTLTSQTVDEARDRIVAACRTELGAELRA